MANNPKYNETPPSLDDGQEGQLQVDSSGNLLTASSVMGAVDDPSETDETQSATMISLLKGILETLKAIEVNTSV
jgi:hypothetical protein